MTQEWPPGPCPLPAQTPGSWAGGAMQPSVPSGQCCETLRSTPRFRRNSSVSRSSPPLSCPGRSCWRRALRRRRGTPLLEPAGLTLTPLTGTCPPPTQAPSGRQSGPPWPSALDTHSAPWAWTPHQQASEGLRRLSSWSRLCLQLKTPKWTFLFPPHSSPSGPTGGVLPLPCGHSWLSCIPQTPCQPIWEHPAPAPRVLPVEQPLPSPLGHAYDPAQHPSASLM